MSVRLLVRPLLHATRGEVCLRAGKAVQHSGAANRPLRPRFCRHRVRLPIPLKGFECGLDTAGNLAKPG